MADEVKDTVEVAEPQVAEKTAPTAQDVSKDGWSQAEIDAAKKRGMLAEEKKAEPKTEKVEAKVEEKKPEPKRSSIPDFTIDDPAKEKVFLDTFGPGTNHRAMYFGMKNERHRRQAAEARTRELEARIKALEETPRTEAPVEDENRPLTLADIKRLQQQEAEAYSRQNAEMAQRAQAVTSSQKEQEDYARAQFDDFDTTVKMAADVMQNVEAMFPEKWKQTKVVKMIRDLQTAAANADKIGLDEYNAAVIAYELGRMHPEYGKTPTTGNSHGDPKDGALSPELMKRVEDNARKRASSASVQGANGRRSISVEDVDLSVINKMTGAERLAFKTKYPDKYAKLLRG